MDSVAEPIMVVTVIAGSRVSVYYQVSFFTLSKLHLVRSLNVFTIQITKCVYDS